MGGEKRKIREESEEQGEEAETERHADEMRKIREEPEEEGEEAEAERHAGEKRKMMEGPEEEERKAKARRRQVEPEDNMEIESEEKIWNDIDDAVCSDMEKDAQHQRHAETMKNETAADETSMMQVEAEDKMQQDSQEEKERLTGDKVETRL